MSPLRLQGQRSRSVAFRCQVVQANSTARHYLGEASLSLNLFMLELRAIRLAPFLLRSHVAWTYAAHFSAAVRATDKYAASG